MVRCRIEHSHGQWTAAAAAAGATSYRVVAAAGPAYDTLVLKIELTSVPAGWRYKLKNAPSLYGAGGSVCGNTIVLAIVGLSFGVLLECKPSGGTVMPMPPAVVGCIHRLQDLCSATAQVVWSDCRTTSDASSSSGSVMLVHLYCFTFVAAGTCQCVRYCVEPLGISRTSVAQCS